MKVKVNIFLIVALMITVASAGTVQFNERFEDPNLSGWEVIYPNTIGDIQVIDANNGYLLISRENAGNDLSEPEGLGISKGVNINVYDSTKIIFDVQAVYSNINNGSGLNNDQFPIIIKLLLETVNGEAVLQFAYNYRGGSVKISDNFYQAAFGRIWQGIWLKNEAFWITDYFPEATAIKKITIYGSGWDFTGMVDNLKIVTDSTLAQTYIQQGRIYLFDPKVSSTREAYNIFNEGYNDLTCVDCQTDRELAFFHALTRTLMLIGRDNNENLDSILEMSKLFGLKILGDDYLSLSASYPVNKHDYYQIPTNAPNFQEVANWAETWMIPELTEIIAEMDSITENEDDLFKVWFYPGETTLAHKLEFDFGDLMLLKGGLSLVKSALMTQLAYDLYLEPEDMLMEKYYGNCINLNELLNTRPDFLKLLPTSNDNKDGATILAQSKEGLLDSIDYYLAAVDYIRNENVPPGKDDQSDELLYIDANSIGIVNRIDEELLRIRNSLVGDYSELYTYEKVKSYSIDKSNIGNIGSLQLSFNPFDICSKGQLLLDYSFPFDTRWQVESMDIEGNWFAIELDYENSSDTSIYGYGQGYLTGTISNDKTKLDNLAFSCWGYWYYDNSSHYNKDFLDFSGTLITDIANQIEVDINPILGSSRYPIPVSLRELFPEFDYFNYPVTGTIAKGMDYDATLGGILPGKTQRDWQLDLNLQPAYICDIPVLSPWQINTFPGPGIPRVSFWYEDQVIFYDIADDLEEDIEASGNLDIAEVFLGYNPMFFSIEGMIAFNDLAEFNENRRYTLYFSPSKESRDVPGSIKIEIVISNGSAMGSFYEYQKMDYYGSWMMSDSITAMIQEGGVSFGSMGSQISKLPGRFFSVTSSYADTNGYEYVSADKNNTRIRMAGLGSVSGNISYDAWDGEPLFVQVYADKDDPDGSIISSTMVTEPGEYTLTDIPLGSTSSMYGSTLYIKAKTPIFGFENYELGCLDVEKYQEFYQWRENTTGVDIDLKYPTMLNNAVTLEGEFEIYTPGMSSWQGPQEKWYCFDTIESGTYVVDVNNYSHNAIVGLYSRDSKTRIFQPSNFWEEEIHFSWICPKSGRYFIKVSNDYYWPCDMTYDITLRTNMVCPSSDVASIEGIGVKDCIVDLFDINVFSYKWLQNTSEPFWGEGCDFNKDGIVNFEDYALFSQEWMSDMSAQLEN